jgi:hypothetical protein
MTNWRDRLDASGKVGAFGCAAGRGRVVRVLWEGEGKPPKTVVDVECPCGQVHPRVALSWRSSTPLDEGREPDLVLTGGGE